jgi:hypothetical protein
MSHPGLLPQRPPPQVSAVIWLPKFPIQKVLQARILFLCIDCRRLFLSKAPFLYKHHATPGAECLFMLAGYLFLGVMREEYSAD